MRLTVFALGLAYAGGLAATGCFNPDLGQGGFPCASNGQLCPEGYECREDNTCWNKGHSPRLDLGSGDLADLPEAGPKPISCNAADPMPVAQPKGVMEPISTSGAKTADLVLTGHGPRVVVRTPGTTEMDPVLIKDPYSDAANELFWLGSGDRSGIAAAAGHDAAIGDVVHVVYTREVAGVDALPFFRCRAIVNTGECAEDGFSNQQLMPEASSPDLEAELAAVKTVHALDAAVASDELHLVATVTFDTGHEPQHALAVVSAHLTEQKIFSFEPLAEGQFSHPQIAGDGDILVVSARAVADTEPVQPETWLVVAGEAVENAPEPTQIELGDHAKGRAAVAIRRSDVFIGGVEGDPPMPLVSRGSFEGARLKLEPLWPDVGLEIIPSSPAVTYIAYQSGNVSPVLAGIAHPPGVRHEAAFRVFQFDSEAPRYYEHGFGREMGSPLVELKADDHILHGSVEATVSDERRLWYLECPLVL